jgi:hypothetical protein
MSAGEIVDRSTFEVVGPVERTDARDRVWFEYATQVDAK